MSSVRAVSDTEYSEGDDNSGRGLSAREEGLTTSVGDPDPHIFTGIQICDPGFGIRPYFQRILIQIRDPREKQCESPTLYKRLKIVPTALSCGRHQKGWKQGECLSPKQVQLIPCTVAERRYNSTIWLSGYRVKHKKGF